MDMLISSALLKRADTQVDRHMENDSLAQLARSQESINLSSELLLNTYYVTVESTKEESHTLKEGIYTS